MPILETNTLSAKFSGTLDSLRYSSRSKEGSAALPAIDQTPYFGGTQKCSAQSSIRWHIQEKLIVYAPMTVDVMLLHMPGNTIYPQAILQFLSDLFHPHSSRSNLQDLKEVWKNFCLTVSDVSRHLTSFCLIYACFSAD